MGLLSIWREDRENTPFAGFKGQVDFEFKGQVDFEFFEFMNP